VTAGEASGVAGIDVWRLALAPGRLAALRAILSAEEIARADAFCFAPDRDRYVSFRGTLRQVLGSYLHAAPEGIPIAAGPDGKPHLAGGGLEFNLAHSGDAGLLAVSRRGPVGIDIEATDRAPDHDRIAARVLSEAEREVFDILPPERRRAAFLRAWTCKEAYAKATGEGLSFPFARITVALTGPARLVAVEGRAQEAARWTLHDLSDHTHAGALAAPPGAALRRFDHKKDIPTPCGSHRCQSSPRSIGCSQVTRQRNAANTANADARRAMAGGAGTAVMEAN
jgi:4'-phosphopantetheinyl transferase